LKSHKIILCSVVGLFSLAVQAQYYQARDLTLENTFSENIEGPNVDKKGNLFVVNYKEDGTIGIIKPNGKASLYLALPKGSVANSIMFDANENLLLADWKGHNILRVAKKTKAISIYYHNSSFNQPNDLCINRSGQLFVSDPNWKNSTGQLWRIDSNQTAYLLEGEMGTSNGIELSPDEKVLYVNESVQRKIWAYDVDTKGNISNKRLLISFEDFGLDGMKCDMNGNLYIARFGKGTIAIITPEGELVREVHLKGKNVSNIVFGGKDGRTCYVTLQDRKCVETFRSEIPGKRWR
jgi:gluconolactonase